MEIDENEIIIQIVSDYKCIYDKSSESYKDNVFKKNAWLQIADRVNKITEIPIDDVRAKNIWKRLREKYADERRKILTYVPSGSGSKENRSDWTYYNSMQFVQKCVDHIQTRSNIKRLKIQNDAEYDKWYDTDDEHEPERESEPELETDVNSIPTVDDSMQANNNRAIDCRTVNYLSEIKRAWKRIPNKNRRKCFLILEDMIDSEIKD